MLELQCIKMHNGSSVAALSGSPFENNDNCFYLSSGRHDGRR
jgi:hypothetical protein